MNEPDVEATQVRSDAKNTMSGLKKLIGAIRELSVLLGAEEPGGHEQEKQALLTRIDLAVLEDIPGILFSVKSLEGGVGKTRCTVITSLVSEGERYLNRARSALSDGYVRETQDSLSEARARFEEAQKSIEFGFKATKFDLNRYTGETWNRVIPSEDMKIWIRTIGTQRISDTTQLGGAGAGTIQSRA